MAYRIEPFTALCECAVFEINGVRADTMDFGYGEDFHPEDAEPYGCGDRQFIIDEELKPETMKKYGITEEEYNKIADELVEKLSFGYCGWCI